MCVYDERTTFLSVVYLCSCAWLIVDFSISQRPLHMDYLVSWLVFLCALTDSILEIISLTFPIGSLHFSYCCLCCIGIKAMEKWIDFLLAFFSYWVFWQWRNKMTPCLHFFILGILAMEKWNDFMSAFFIFRILAMKKQNDFMSTFYYLVFWQWKNRMTSCLHFYIWHSTNGKTIKFLTN